MTLDFYEAVEYVWSHSPVIQNWYLEEHDFDLDDYSRSEYRTFGHNAPGEIVSEILHNGLQDGIIVETDNGYEVPA